jgi:phage-related tail fiber protein
MSNTIQIKRSSTASSVPTAGQLAQGELAVNLVDKKLYTKDNTNTVIQLNPEPPAAVPAGSVITVAMNTAPTGYLKANGAVVSRSTYAALFAAIGTTFGAGDGSTTFGLPDLRGEFIRGWDDGRGVDSGRGIGTAQGDAIRNLTGFADIRGDGNPGAAHYTTSGTSGVFVTPPSTSKVQHTTGTRTVSAPHGIQFNASNQVPTASENRPRNVALLACIKF